MQTKHQQEEQPEQEDLNDAFIIGSSQPVACADKENTVAKLLIVRKGLKKARQDAVTKSESDPNVDLMNK